VTQGSKYKPLQDGISYISYRNADLQSDVCHHISIVTGVMEYFTTLISCVPILIQSVIWIVHFIWM